MIKPVTCIYHKDCVDGTTAGAVVLLRFPHARLFPLSHGYTQEDIDPILAETPHDAEIYIVDSVLGMEACIERGHEVTILDHHASVHEQVKHYAKAHSTCTYIYDNSKSGASLAWSHFFPEKPMPQLIAHVEDDDIWLQKFGKETKYVRDYLSTFRNNPTFVATCIETDIHDIYSRGENITQYVETEIAHFLTKKPILLTLGTDTIPAYNITTHQSMCGNLLSTRHKSAVALYTISGKDVKISFRSQAGQEPSARAFAERIGGGGHEYSSGGRMDLADFITQISYL